ncbi:hypothetical protein [Paractinoplanes durhamensis]|uniref:hypothetical protein n=1 Tax=Paractinoplanes durhamensis TaxID=113563 RepID=UPI003645CCA3
MTTIDKNDVVTLSVSKVYKGTQTTLVQVDQAPNTSETMLGSGTFEVGKSYLVAANEGTIMICGYSGESDIPGLLDLFEQAF